MAYVHEVKFFIRERQLYVALFDKPPFFSNEFWLKNIPAQEIGISKLPEGLILEKKYQVEELGIKPFQVTKLQFELMDNLAKIAWKKATGFI